MTSPFKICVVTEPLGPPKPVAFEVKDKDGKTVAWFEPEQVRYALERFDELAQARAAARRATATAPSPPSLSPSPEPSQEAATTPRSAA